MKNRRQTEKTVLSNYVENQIIKQLKSDLNRKIDQQKYSERKKQSLSFWILDLFKSVNKGVSPSS